MSFVCAQPMGSVAADCGDCSSARTSSTFLRILGIAAAVSFLFVLVAFVVRLRLCALAICVLSLLALIIIIIEKRKPEGIER